MYLIWNRSQFLTIFVCTFHNLQLLDEPSCYKVNCCILGSITNGHYHPGFVMFVWICLHARNSGSLGTVHYLWRGVAPKRNVFRGKNFADPTIKKVENLITQPQILILKIYPPLTKNFTKGYHSVVTYVLYHFCDMSLIDNGL